MKKLSIIILTIALLFSLFPNSISAANSITNRLKGRLLLQVEQGGAIWYVNPVDLQKYQVTWANALSLFQNFALGITNADLLKIPADLNSIRPNLDSDNDGYTDVSELTHGFSPYIPGAYKGEFTIDNNLANHLKGRLLLQVEQGGAIWYVDIDGVRHNVRWDNLMYLFTTLALGITDADLAIVGEWQTYINSEYGYEIKYPENLTIQEPTPTKDVAIINTQGEEYLQIQYLNTTPQEYYTPYTADFIGKVQIGGKEADKYFTNNPSGEGAINLPFTGYVIVLGTKQWINIRYFANPETANIFEQILSTFKFTDTANWQTYTNSEYEFEVKYPKEWIFNEKGSVGKDPYSGKDLGSLEVIHFGTSPVDLNLKAIVDIWNTSFYSLDQLKSPSPNAFNIEEKNLSIDKGEAIEVNYKEVSDIYGEVQKKMLVMFRSDTRDLIYRITGCESTTCSQMFSTFKFLD